MGLQDRDYVKSNNKADNDAAWHNLKPESIELESHQNRRRPVVSSESLPLWAQIMFGILAAAAVMFIGRELYTRYQFYQLQQYMEQQSQILKQRSEETRTQLRAQAEQRQQRLDLQNQQRQAAAAAREDAKRQQALLEAQQRKLTSDKCRFWTDNYNSYKTEKSKEMMASYCNLRDWKTSEILRK